MLMVHYYRTDLFLGSCYAKGHFPEMRTVFKVVVILNISQYRQGISKAN